MTASRCQIGVSQWGNSRSVKSRAYSSLAPREKLGGSPRASQTEVNTAGNTQQKTKNNNNNN